VKKLILAALTAALAMPARAQTVTIKLGTLAPIGSSWHELLKELGQRWGEASGGRVRLRVYAGGAQGSEGDMVRKMGINQLQAASITNVGMHDVIPDPQVMSVPGLFRDEAEMGCAFERLRPGFEQAFTDKGFTVLQWSQVGAITLFCTRPVRTPAEMSRVKVFAWEGDPGSVEAWRAAGFRPVVLSSTDIVPSLQTGMIDCVTNVPLYMLTARIFEKARYMTDLPWGWILGATVVRTDAWEKIPAELRPRLLEIAQELGRKVDAEVRRLNQDAVKAMKTQGLEVVAVDPAPWRATMAKAHPVVRARVVPPAAFDRAQAAATACRVGAR